MSELSQFIFIPGGPWISGSYWDAYLKGRFEQSRIYRYSLINHEKNYNRKSSPQLQDAIKELQKLFESKSESKKINIIAHSYGAWLTLLSLNEAILEKVNKIVLVAMPLTLDQPHEIKRALIHRSFDLQSNDDFKRYFSFIFSHYFHDSKNVVKFQNLLDEVYMEKNLKLLMNHDGMAKAILNLEKFGKKIHMIAADFDNIAPPPSHGNHVKSLHIINDSGHFPMLEQPELFTQTLNSIFEEDDL